MPCYDSRNSAGCIASEYQGRINEVTRVSCDMRTVLRRHGLEVELTKEARDWIKMHDKQDADRLEQEEEKAFRKSARLSALNKLSLEERRVLGL